MIRGLYTATSGMTLNERMQEVVSNNIANANTVGYKGDTGVIRSFPEELLLRMHDNKGGVGAENNNGQLGPIGQLSQGAMLEEVIPRFVQGQLTSSDNPHAYAIVDAPQPQNEINRRSYFAVSAAGQTMYTRDGDFKVQAGTDFLVTTKGDPVLPIDSRTGLPVADARIRVAQDGSYQMVTANGQPYPAPNAANPNAPQPQFGIVDVQDSTQLAKYGETYFRGGQAVQSTGELNKGQLEQSNVDLAQTMVTMMNVMRSYEANQRMIRSLDSTLEKAVSVGRIG